MYCKPIYRGSAHILPRPLLFKYELSCFNSGICLRALLASVETYDLRWFFITLFLSSSSPSTVPTPQKKDLFILHWSSPHEFLFCEEMQCTWMNWAKSRTDFPFLQTICCFSNSMNFWENQMTGIKSMLDKTSESQVQLDYWQVGLITVGYYEWTNADFISFRFTKISPLWQKYEELLDTLLLNFPSFSK